jgi:dGTPase
MAGFGGFDHNAQALRIVARLEHRYADFDGLNLTWETLEGLVKHNGPLLNPDGSPVARYARHGVPAAILDYSAQHDLALSTYASAEAQVAAIADDIAYDAHDIDDGLRAGLFTLQALRGVPFLGELLAEIDARWPGLAQPRVIHELGRRVITRFVEDVIASGASRMSPRSMPTTSGAPDARWWASRYRWWRRTPRSSASCSPTCIGIPASWRSAPKPTGWSGTSSRP